MLGELLRFFAWLDLNDEYGWSMPRGLLSSHVKVRRMDCDRRIPKGPSIYTPEQLAVLNKYATPFERLTLYVALNCAMGAAELGRLRVSNVLFDHEHEHAKHVGFESTPNDSWVRTRRPMTDVFGEWRLWPETTAILRWGVERARRLGTEHVFVNEKGRPMWNENSDNPSIRLSCLWSRLIQRVRKAEPDFPAFSLGSLRNVLPTYLLIEFGDEIAAICLTHSRLRHADHHTCRPFGRFHEAMVKAREFFACVFSAVKDDQHSAE
jgi:integrase